jgi:hypothetical protein
VCPNDLSSYANCAEVTTDHFQLDIFVDFDVSAISGNQTLNMTSLKDGLNQIVLDYQGMSILSVLEKMDPVTEGYYNITSKCTSYEDKALGNALIIPLTNCNKY